MGFIPYGSTESTESGVAGDFETDYTGFHPIRLDREH